MPVTPNSVTNLLARWHEGPVVHDEVMPIIYRELRSIAADHFTGERKDHTLQPTELVNEVYLRIRNGGPWQSRGHFFASVSRAMRCILVDHARRRNAGKRSGRLSRVNLEDLEVQLAEPLADACFGHADILAVDQAIERLKIINERWAKVIELRFFGGLSVKEAASVIGVSEGTARKDWSKASQCLKDLLTKQKT